MKKNDISIHRFKIEDLEEVARLIHTTIQTVYPGYYPPAVIDYFLDYHNKQAIKQRAENGFTIICRKNKTITATASLTGDTIYGMYVLPQYSGKGIGKRLIGIIEKKALNQKINLLKLHATPGSRSFYLKMGYQIVNEDSMLVGADRLYYTNMEKKLM